MQQISWYGILILVFSVSIVGCTVYYTDNKATFVGVANGSWGRPFQSISECVKNLKIAGDECHIRAGRYHETVEIIGLRGKDNAPFVIRGYGDERPLLDGTVELLPNSGKWEKRNNGRFCGKISHKIWQLFLGDLMMTNARWPNAKWSDKSLFDGKHNWAKVGKESKIGNIVNRNNSLADSGLDMTGAIAILNIGSWNTFVAKVDSHTAGQNSFTYTDTFGSYKIQWKVGQYFLEDKVNLLDAPEEWYFDRTTNFLCFIPPDSATFDVETKLRGKVQTYAMTISDSQHVHIKNMDFYGTTIQGYSNKKHIDHINFDSLNFMFPSASQRMLGEISPPNGMNINGSRSTNTGSTFTFFNNTFHGADGIPLRYKGANVLVKNNLFEYNDWTSANFLTWGKVFGTMLSESAGGRETIIRNTLYKNGEAHGIVAGDHPSVTLNRVIGQCWGTQQNDGAGIHITRKNQDDCHLSYNWIHDSPKYGIRFDGQPPRIGLRGTLINNVAVRLGLGGIQMKGDYHKMNNCLAFDTQKGTPRQSVLCSLCAWKYVRTNPVEINTHSSVEFNMADALNGGKKCKNGKIISPPQVWPIQGAVVRNNIVDREIKHMMHDPDNFDFRVLKDTPAAKEGAGPYPYQRDRLTNYWIPGRQLYKASSPVPQQGAKKVIAKHRDAVMWLNGYNCEMHEIYFGNNKNRVEQATKTNDEFLGSVSGDGNVMYLKKVEGAMVYYWRVDALRCGANGDIFKGDIWEFRTLPGPAMIAPDQYTELSTGLTGRLSSILLLANVTFIYLRDILFYII